MAGLEGQAETLVRSDGQTSSLTDEVRELETSLARLRLHRTETTRAAQGSVGSQAGHTLNARARVLSTCITELEATVLRLKDSLGLVGQLADPATGAARTGTVAGGFDITIECAVSLPGQDLEAAAREQLHVWPGKTLTAVIIEAITLFGLEQLAGVWGLWKVGGSPDPMQELTIGDARVEEGDVLQLRRVSSS